jgi:hypothetical protein
MKKNKPLSLCDTCVRNQNHPKATKDQCNGNGATKCVFYQEELRRPAYSETQMVTDMVAGILSFAFGVPHGTTEFATAVLCAWVPDAKQLSK